MTELEEPEDRAAEEVAAGYEQFRSRMQPRPATPEEEAALTLAIEVSNAEKRFFIEENSGTAMAERFPADHRETALNDLALTMDLAADLHRTWREESDPAELLTSARAVRDATQNLIVTIERLWPDGPPYDPWQVLEG